MPFLVSPFVVKGGVVCARKTDIIKVRRAINTLHYFGQIGALQAAGRCQLYARRQKVIDLLPSNRADRLAAVQVRTEDKPSEMRWALRKDVREIAR
ncbi:MAG: hypothetical protein HYS06_02400 [Methylocystis sp.]|nr:hypothetical protein [Methylocystis sp.]MBI3275598.1 hypothetical protein [Methylocystis sp.]